MHFMLGDGWHVSFLEADCKTSLPMMLTFGDEEKILEMARRGGAEMTSAELSSLRHAFSIGRGEVLLRLTAEQYGRLKRGR